MKAPSLLETLLGSNPATELYHPLELNVKITAENFAAGRTKFSWSKWKAAQACPASWIATNFATWALPRSTSIDDKSSTTGWIIQKAFEVWFNSKIFLEFNTPELARNWFERAILNLAQLLIRPYATQFEIGAENIRYYFRSAKGKAEIDAQILLGLDPRLKYGLSLKFINPQDIELKWGSYERFLALIINSACDSWAKMLEVGMDPNQALSELYVEGKMSKYIINGGVDFIFNPPGTGHPGKRAETLKDGFTITDGKWTLGATLAWEQLSFYAAAIQFNFRRTAGALGLFNWTTSEFVWGNPYNPGYALDLRRRIDEFHLTQNANEAWLTKAATSSTRVTLEDIPNLEFRPAKFTCIYCPAVHSCSAAKRAGLQPERPDFKSQPYTSEGTAP